MGVKFNTVRIGNKRKNPNAEILVRQNYDELKSSIKHLIETEFNEEPIEIALVIPEKGFDTKMILENIKNGTLIKTLKKRFPNNQYKGAYCNIERNLFNKLF
ncbi:hypothetical protein [Nonlabens marinus]|uniref:Uncharacterized protein n=1 Tax=Nonlabens marinus S1-08 TaxID=1454201 RepID=W8VQ26_9FLAO|nr:hypothetical protein [Nonlabens marinus]BAO54810.1 hypothetical protein NMS_0801 [Nonlabens marinus S1-08]